MRSSAVWLFPAALAGTLAGSLRAGEPSTPAGTVKAVEEDLVEKWSHVKSVSATMAIDTKKKIAVGNLKVSSKGSFELVKEGNKRFLRWDMHAVSTLEKDGKEEQEKSSTLTITDGEYTWGLAEQEGKRMYLKANIDDAYHLGVRRLLATLRENGEIKVLPDESLGGQAVKVLSVDLMEEGERAGTMTYYFAKDTGLLLKTVTAGLGGEGSVVTLLTDVKLNVEIPRDRFVFRAPEGVEVQDMTGGK